MGVVSVEMAARLGSCRSNGYGVFDVRQTVRVSSQRIAQRVQQHEQPQPTGCSGLLWCGAAHR
jgi:hypothetical protein